MKTNEELVVEYQSGNKHALSELCQKNRGLVANIARSFTGETEDLFQSGMMGLIEAANRFDSERGAKFTTYASNWIFAKCVTCAKNTNELVHINGREGRRVLNLIGRVKKSLMQELDREPTVAEIAREMQIDEGTVASVIGISGQSLNMEFDDEEGRGSLSEIIPDNNETPDQISESLSLVRAVRAFSETLESEVEKFVFLNVMAGDMTNHKAGEIRGVSRQRINQIVVSLRPRFEKYAIMNKLVQP